jgi:hypothetical protein
MLNASILSDHSNQRTLFNGQVSRELVFQTHVQDIVSSPKSIVKEILEYTTTLRLTIDKSTGTRVGDREEGPQHILSGMANVLSAKHISHIPNTATYSTTGHTNDPATTGTLGMTDSGKNVTSNMGNAADENPSLRVNGKTKVRPKYYQQNSYL